MRLLCLILIAAFMTTAAAQDKARKKKQQLAHKKPTPEQIRKFKDLEKKHKR